MIAPENAPKKIDRSVNRALLEGNTGLEAGQSDAATQKESMEGLEWTGEGRPAPLAELLKLRELVGKYGEDDETHISWPPNGVRRKPSE